MYLVSDLERIVIQEPYDLGYRSLTVLSGYVSPSFVEQILINYTELQLEIIVGMVASDGIPIWNHQAYLDLLTRFEGRVTIAYQILAPGNHRKIYKWKAEGFLLEERIFLGSANFTLNGFGRQQEVLAEVNYPNINDLFADVTTLGFDNDNIENYINFYTAALRSVTTTRVIDGETEEIESTVLTTTNMNYDSFIVTSFLDNQGNLPRTSGLNWGQREGRDRNQAYIPIRKAIHNANPTFFPELAVPFLIYTDDGHVLRCVMAQSNRKGIHTTDNNAIMGTYFRNRLGVASEAPVEFADLIAYGRDNVRIYKINDETYYLDFSV